MIVIILYIWTGEGGSKHFWKPKIMHIVTILIDLNVLIKTKFCFIEIGIKMTTL